MTKFDAETRKKHEEKSNEYFDIAEQVVKDWLALFLEAEPEILFKNDYNSSQRTKTVSFRHNDQSYSMYLDLDRENEIDKKLLKESEHGGIALKTIHSAIYLVFMPIINTAAEEFKSRLEGLYPCCEESFFRYRFAYRHPIKYQYDTTFGQLQKVIELISQFRAKEAASQANGKTMSDEDLKEMKEHKEKLINAQIDIMGKLNKFNKEDIDKYTEIENMRNVTLQQSPRLYICMDSAFVHNEEETFARLPVIGETFTDPAEESLVSKLKKEHNVL
jgi:hypothetical protein